MHQAGHALLDLERRHGARAQLGHEALGGAEAHAGAQAHGAGVAVDEQERRLGTLLCHQGGGRIAIGRMLAQQHLQRQLRHVHTGDAAQAGRAGEHVRPGLPAGRARRARARCLAELGLEHALTEHRAPARAGRRWTSGTSRSETSGPSDGSSGRVEVSRTSRASCMRTSPDRRDCQLSSPRGTSWDRSSTTRPKAPERSSTSRGANDTVNAPANGTRRAAPAPGPLRATQDRYPHAQNRADRSSRPPEATPRPRPRPGPGRAPRGAPGCSACPGRHRPARPCCRPHAAPRAAHGPWAAVSARSRPGRSMTAPGRQSWAAAGWMRRLPHVVARPPQRGSAERRAAEIAQSTERTSSVNRSPFRAERRGVGASLRAHMTRALFAYVHWRKYCGPTHPADTRISQEHPRLTSA